MRPFSMWLPVHMTRLLCGLFFIALLQGCITVDVNVGTTDVCDKSKAESDPTGCNVPEAWSGSAVGFKNTQTGVIITAPSTLMCSGPNSTRCNTTIGFGNCGIGSNKKACINKYDPTFSICSCGCP